MSDKVRNAQASILDRLIDEEPGVTHESVQQRLVDVRQIRQSVIRELESLLNTRRFILPIPGELREVNDSILAYGLRDFTSFNPRSPGVRQKLRSEVKQAISRFDHRLKNVTVHIDAPEEHGRNISFRITGTLVVEPINEPVTFDTYFDINRGEYVISKY